MSRMLIEAILVIGIIFCLFFIKKELIEIDNQHNKIVKLETDLMWCESADDYMLAIKDLPEEVQDALKARNHQIKLEKKE